EIIDECRSTDRHPKFTKDFPSGIEYYQIEEVTNALAGADLLICGVSSFGVDWFAGKILPLVPENLPVLSVTKGLIDGGDGNLISYPEYWQRHSAPRKLCLNAIGGPCTSYELVARDPSVVTFCGDDTGVLQRLKEMMETAYYHISISTDVMGVESAVALKNAYALGVTVAVGLNEKYNGIDSKEHYNSQAAVFGQATLEMQKMLRLLAGSDGALYVGIGDLYVTTFSGRTRRLGVLLGRGLTLPEALKELEGITLESNVIIERLAVALRSMSKRGTVDIRDFPLMAALGEVFLDGREAYIPWEDFVE
ncbi:MAG: glycerol-3-phosphate dehydrogenase, partial [Dysgonamonadaceae bacterium]|nr:glycerol-3-phosphate dehydrogenase [Dysgonamonadaceae bacterium]